jgi:hypothetical protein
MATNHPGSAQIYTFPPRGRFLARSTPETAQPLTSWQQQPAVASGSGWYHDEAIAQARETESRRKN